MVVDSLNMSAAAMDGDGMNNNNDFNSLFANEERAASSKKPDRWKILVVDDEPDVHAVTEAALDNVVFEGEGVRLLSAFSAEEGRRMLREHPDIAIVFLDIVMESAHAGLALVDFIRETLGNSLVRIVVRTGRPESAPMREVLTRYEINGYNIKTDLPADELFAAVISSLRSYRTLKSIHAAREDLGRSVEERTRELGDSQTLCRVLVETMNDGLEIHDDQGRITYANDSFSRILGRPPGEIIGKPVTDFLDDVNRALLKKQMEAPPHEVKVEPFEIEWMRKNGEAVPTIMSPRILKNAGAGGGDGFAVVTDISKFKRVEETLRRQNEYMAALHETSLGMLNRLDLNELLNIIVNRASDLVRMPDGFLHLYNPLQKVLEVKAGRGLFKNHIGFRIKPGEGLVGLVWDKGETMVVEDYRTWAGRLPDGRLSPVRAALAIPLKSSSGIEGVIGISDRKERRKVEPETVKILEQFARLAVIAIENARLYGALESELSKREKLEKERETMEIQLNQAQKMEAIGVLAGGIAHDFNNILASILGYTELALEDAEKGTLLQKNLKDVMMAGKRAADLVQQILTFSRQTEFELKPVQVQLIVKEVMSLLRATLPSTIRIRNNIRSESLILSDPTQIHQVLMNLCANAAHAMQESGGELFVELVDMEVDADFVQNNPELKPGPHVSLLVKDTGHGMTPEVLNRIFVPFFTTKQRGEGTGMGLSVIHGIVKSHGGSIIVYSELGKGATFQILFPAVERRPEDEGARGKSIPGGSECILFVDDEAPVVEMGRQILRRLGYTVVARTSSVEALELFKARPEKFDVVITDMTMPIMTGEDLAREVLRRQPGTPIILCTGFSANMDEPKAREMGIRAFVPKPFLIQELAVKIRAVLDGKNTFETGDEDETDPS
ncbi:MAG: response regulator [Desulfobacterales bacterium]|nr:response regulator [Desulfobacterales bacterium]